MQVLNEADSIPFVKRALELGINFFDTADVYSNGQSEVVLGLYSYSYPLSSPFSAHHALHGSQVTLSSSWAPTAKRW